MARPQKIYFVSLGCPKNRVDTEVMVGVAKEAGFELCLAPEEAGCIVVNTCGFIAAAKEESVDTILAMARFKEAGVCERLVVAGCLSQRYSDELARLIPEVDHFLGSSDMLKLRGVLDHDSERVLVGNPADYIYRASDPRVLSQGRHSVYLKIAEGCDRGCSFCAIPSIRGRQRSRPLEDIVLEATRLCAGGALELNLVSQDTIAWGRDLHDRPALSDLLRALGELPSLRWIRLHYLYPERLTRGLIELIATHPKVVKYVDIPLQHASDSMLRRMGRGHGGERLRRVVEAVRGAIPGVVFRTAFIVGHPGEGASDFDELCEFVSWAEFDRVGVFRYSGEEGTRSESQNPKVSPRESYARHRRLMALQRAISRKRNRAMIGRRVEVLVDGSSDEHQYVLQGRWAGQAPEVDGVVFLSGAEVSPGTMVLADITQAADYDLVGEVVLGATKALQARQKRRVSLPTISSGAKEEPKNVDAHGGVD